MEKYNSKGRRSLCKSPLAYLRGGDPSKRFDCILVNPGICSLYSTKKHGHLFEDIIPSYGLAVLASAISKAGFNTAILDADIQGLKTPLDIASVVNSIKPCAIGLSISTPCYFSAREFAINLDNDIDLYIGGPHPSALPFQTLNDFGTFSQPKVITGPGEEALCKLLKKVCDHDCTMSLKTMQNKVFSPALPKSMKPLLSDYQCISPSTLKNRTAFLLSSRGCPYKCSFCSIHITSGNKILRNSIKNIVKEIKNYIRQGINIIRFLDDLFIYNDNIIHEFRDMMEESDLLGKISWYANARVDIIQKLSESSLKAMVESGCKGVGIGVESASNRILAETKKGFKSAEALKSVKRLTNIGLKVYCYFIIGFPTESYQEALDTISFADELRCNYKCRCGIVPYKLYPGTYDYHQLIGLKPSLSQVHKLSRFRAASILKNSDPPHIKKVLARREPFIIFHDERYFSPHSMKMECIESMIADFYRSSPIFSK